MKWILALITLALFSNLFAEPRQWDVNGVAVRQAYDLQWYGQSARADDGSVMMVWTDARNGFFELFGQLLSPEGDPQWGENGRFLARSEAVGIYWPAIAYSQDGWIVFWQDVDEHIADEEVDIPGRVKVMKFDANGQSMWNDPEQTGVLVYDEQDESLMESRTSVVPDEAGGAYVSWATYDTVSMQRIDAAGTVVWAAPVVFGLIQWGTVPVFCSDGQGNLVAAWYDLNASRDIYCNKYGPDGLPLWAAPVLVREVLYYAATLKLVADGAGGAVLVWTDESDGFSTDIFAQRVSADGVTMWQENGVPVVTAPDDQNGARIAASISNGEVDGVLVTWEDVRETGTNSEPYVQKLNLGGEPVWQIDGVSLCTGDHQGVSQRDPTVISDLNGGAVASWSEYSGTYSAIDIKLSRLSAAGIPVWNVSCGVAIEDLNYPSAPKIVLGGDNNVFSLWQASYEPSGGLFRQVHDLEAGDPIAPLPQAVNEVIDGEAGDQAALALPDGRVVFAWQDSRQMYQNPYFQILNADGTGQYMRDGIKLVEPVDPDNARLLGDPVLCEDGGGGFFATFEDMSSNFRVIRATRWNANGQHVGPAQGVILSDPTSDAEDPVVTPDNAGGALVTYSGYGEQFQLEVYVTRIGGNCQLLWDEPLTFSADPVNDIQLVSVVPSDDGSCILVLRTGEWTAYSYRAAKVLPDGTIVWDIEVTSPELNADFASVASDKANGAAMIWRTVDETGTNDDVYAQRINSGGTLMWAAEGLPVAVSEASEFSPRVCVDELGNLIVAWVMADQQEVEHIYTQKIAPSGDFMWQPGGTMIESEFPSMGEMIAVNHQNIYVTWSASTISETGVYHNPVFATHLNALGEVADDPFWHMQGGAAICDATLNWGRPLLVETTDGSAVVSWLDHRSRSESASLYAQRLYDPIPVAVDEKPTIPLEFSLSQNYPNPFNPETVIEFALPISSKAMMKVFDVTGRTVATLIDAPLTAGVHRVNFNAQSLASGVYFYTLRAADRSMTRKMVLLK